MVLKMTELTDLEICKKIAEIEGFQFTYDRNGTPYILKMWAECEEHPLPTRYNPLVDKALCFDLMVKYAVKLQIEMNREYYARSRKTGGSSYNIDPVRAILLAIIGDDDD